jgi:hypothetical protein
MAIESKELKRWLATLDDDAVVFMDEGGLTIYQLVDQPDADTPCLEIGGEPEEQIPDQTFYPSGVSGAPDQCLTICAGLEHRCLKIRGHHEGPRATQHHFACSSLIDRYDDPKEQS